MTVQPSGLHLTISPAGFPVLTRDSAHVELTRMQTALLAVLAREPLRGWTKAEMEDAVWGSALTSPPGTFKLLDVMLTALRRRAGQEVVVTREAARRRSGAASWWLGPAVAVTRVARECEPGATPAGVRP